MLGIKEYIEQNIGGTPVYNLPQWRESFDLGGASYVKYEAPRGDNVEFIIINLIKISVPQQVTSGTIIHEASNTNLMTINNLSSQLVIAPFNFLVVGNSFSFKCTDDALFWSLNFTPVTLAKK